MWVAHSPQNLAGHPPLFCHGFNGTAKDGQSLLGGEGQDHVDLALPMGQVLHQGNA